MSLRLQFNLRALLLLTALVAGIVAWLTYTGRIVHERKNGLANLEIANRGWPAITRRDIPRASSAQVSWVRRLMGDTPIVTIVYYPDQDDSDRTGLARIRRVFPEAEIWCKGAAAISSDDAAIVLFVTSLFLWGPMCFGKR